MKKKFLILLLVMVLVIMTYLPSALPEFSGTHIYAIKVENIEQGYLYLTFNDDGTIIGEAHRVKEEKTFPIIGVWGKRIFVVKYKLTDEVEILDHCRFISDSEFIGFERSIKEGVPVKGIAKLFGSKRDRI